MADVPPSDDPVLANSSSERRALDAAKRWKARAGKRRQRAQGTAKDAVAISDTAERLTARVSRLRGLLAARALIEGSAPKRVQDIITHVPKASEMTEAFAERVIGETRDYLSIEFFERGLAAATCVGRILTNGQINGTGFLVAPDIVITNNHVLPSERFAALSELELDYEDNTFGESKRPQGFALDPAGFFITDAVHDFTLVAVKPDSHENKRLADFGHLPLIADEGKIAVGESVNIVQHPKGRYKQIVIRNSRLVDLPEGTDADIYFHYEADTEKGSSGSPVFSDQWEVVALHHSGVPKTNAKGEIVDKDDKVVVPYDEEQVAWIANEGVRTSRLVKAVSEVDLTNNPAFHARRAGLLAKWLSDGKPGTTIPNAVASETKGVRPPPVTTESQAPERGAGKPARPVRTAETIAPAPSGSRQSLSFTVPLRIDVTLGGAPSATAPVGLAPAAASVFQESIQPDPDDPDYAHRPGYQPTFLGFDVPLPSLKDTRHGPLATFGPDTRSELTYHHYSVLMNARRRLAYVAAVNIDSGAPFQHEREGGDRWFFDPRLPKKQQAGAPYYASNPFDRGHLVRRDDAAWGQSEDEARLANDDTFHWTNCTPQHEIFNQSSKATKNGLHLWGNLENAVSALAPRFGAKLCVFNGPVFAEDDRPYRDNFFIPAAYWKLIVLRDEAGKKRALAFRLSQADQLKDLTAERFAPDELADFAVFQVPVTQLETATGLDFGPMRGWDPLAEPAALTESGAPVGAVLIRSEGAIRI